MRYRIIIIMNLMTIIPDVKADFIKAEGRKIED